MNERNLHNSYTDLAPLLAKRFRERREQLGISQEAVANAAYISLFSYSKFERGKSNPDTPMNPELATLLAIARALKMDICELLNFDDACANSGGNADADRDGSGSKDESGKGAAGGSESGKGAADGSKGNRGATSDRSNACMSEVDKNEADGSSSPFEDDLSKGHDLGDNDDAKSHIYKRESSEAATGAATRIYAAKIEEPVRKLTRREEKMAKREAELAMRKGKLTLREGNVGREEMQFEAELTSEEFARALGKKLQQLRWERDMTTQETAHLAGISMHRYHYLEKGESRPGTPANPKLSTLVGLANAFNIPLHKLLELHTIEYAVVPF